MTRVWVRNCGNYIREAKAAGCLSITFDRGYLINRNMDLFKFLGVHLSETDTWECIIVDDNGSRHYTSDKGNEHIAVYPTWNASEDSMDLLQDWIDANVGDDPRSCNDKEVAPEWRPILGQEHRIIIHNLPSHNLAYGKSFMRLLARLQAENPHCTLFIHGSYAISAIGILGYREVDIEPRTDASQNKVWLPNGKRVVKAHLKPEIKWVNSLGYSAADLADPRTRCIFNIKSAIRQLETPSDSYIMNRTDERPDHTVPDSEFRPKTDGKTMMKRVKGNNMLGDKVECNVCSLAQSCKYYRKGSVCTVPGSEMSELAMMFKSRDSATILDGMARLTAMAAARTERAVVDEDDFGLDPETTKMLNQTFNFAERYAKLNDPFLRASVTFQHLIEHGGKGTEAIPGVVQLSQLSASDAAAMAIEHYEKQGIARIDITMEMVQSFIASLNSQPAIEGTVIEK